MGKLRILIVDDEHVTRLFLKGCLQASFPGCIVVEAASAKTAIDTIKSELFNIVLCDRQLPDMNGDEILQWVREESDVKGMPFMMITGDSDRENIEKAISLGVSGYVVKPLDCASLSQRIAAVLSPKQGGHD